MRNLTLLISILAILTISCQKPNVQKKIDLSGTWQFAADPSDIGISEGWFNQTLMDSLTLPGSMTSNGKGDEITLATQWTGQIVDSSFFKNPEYAKFREPGNIKIPFWLQPLKYYKGAAWYQKEVSIPEDWKSQDVELFLERCHWESRLWVDNKAVGMQNSLGTPHQYDLTNILTPGKHRLTLCIDNRVKDIDPGVNSHSISDHTQSNWNGIVGRIYLESHPLVNIRNIQVYPDIRNKKFKAKVKVVNTAERPVKVELKLSVTGAGTPESQSGKFVLITGENILSMEYPMGKDIKLWNEFHPEIYHLTAVLTDQVSEKSDTCNTTFGMREFKAIGNQLMINEQPVFLRGTLECSIFPKTGYPATDVKEWLRIFSVCRAHGLNHMRFHSWCPPQAAFDAADQSGFYLQVECSSWANQSTTLGDGKPFDKYLYEESQRMVEQYGNHPSFCMMVYGNEPGGKNQVPFLTEFVSFWKKKDNRRIYTSGAGWPNLSVNDYISDSEPRIQHWGQGLGSIINSKAPGTDYDWSSFNSKFPQPVVSHEIGQWCVYPNFKEITKYDGVMRARNFELFQETLGDHGMGQLADSFLLASGKLQALCYKADIEAALRTPKFGGFQLLDLHDFPGQGTALVGVLDAFWGEKGYILPAEYKRFCNSTVPLARLKKCIFTNNETFEAAVEVAHYGDRPIKACTPEWKISDKTGKTIQSGKFTQTDIPIGNAFKPGNISFPLSAILTPEKLILEVKIDSLSNSWDFWVYPAKKETITGEKNIRIVQKLDAETAQFLKNGGSILLTLKKGTLSKEMGGDIQIGFSGIFWNTAWTKGQAPHTLGILCNPKHPALADFPTEYYSNYEWWDAMSHSGAINISSLPAEIKPIVRVIDDWVTNRPLALVFEAKVGKGKILISGIDLLCDTATRPEAQQLLFSLKRYMLGSQFNPKAEIAVNQVEKMINQ
ncbi:MAG: beta-galactosidase [Bacteroidia bacterium]|nr:beta-galactosidase [Bacteroidia bacterium]